MELKNVNHDADSTSEAFAGEGKITRIIDKLVEIVNVAIAKDWSKSETIQKAVELYADTTEEAIGIALGVHNAMLNAEKRSHRPDIEGFGDFLSTLRKMTKGTPFDFDGILDESIRGESDEVFKEFFDVHEPHCETCDKNGTCEILDEARKRGIKK